MLKRIAKHVGMQVPVGQPSDALLKIFRLVYASVAAPEDQCLIVETALFDRCDDSTGLSSLESNSQGGDVTED